MLYHSYRLARRTVSSLYIMCTNQLPRGNDVSPQTSNTAVPTDEIIMVIIIFIIIVIIIIINVIILLFFIIIIIIRK